MLVFLPHQNPEFPQTQNPYSTQNPQQQTQSQSQPPQTLTLDSQNPQNPDQPLLNQAQNQQQEAREEDPIIVDKKGEELDKSRMLPICLSNPIYNRVFSGQPTRRQLYYSPPDSPNGVVQQQQFSVQVSFPLASRNRQSLL